MALSGDTLRILLDRYRRMGPQQRAKLIPLLAEYDINLDGLAATGQIDALTEPHELAKLQAAFDRYDQGEFEHEPPAEKGPEVIEFEKYGPRDISA